METTLFVLLILVAIALIVLAAIQEGRKRTVGFWGALLILILLSPILGYIVILMMPLKKPRGCASCGNEKNEAEYCGMCGK